MSTLSVVMLGMRARGLVDELDLVGIAEQRLGDDVAHVDVETLQLVVGALEVPGRVGAAGAEHEVASGENRIELAAFGENRRRDEEGGGQRQRAGAERDGH
mgnify:FL=1